MSPSERQTQLTTLLRDSRNQSRRNVERRSSNWQQALRLCFGSRPSSSTSSTSSSSQNRERAPIVHSGHINPLLSILLEEQQHDMARGLALSLLLPSPKRDESATGIDWRRHLPPRFEPSSATVMILAELLRATDDAQLAAALLAPESTARQVMFPFAAWAACSVLLRDFHPQHHRHPHQQTWLVAIEWYQSAVHQVHANNSGKREKFTSHLKLTSCIAAILVRRAGVPAEEAVRVMDQCRGVPGYDRVVEKLNAAGRQSGAPDR
jgi:hypothetical protein